MGNNYNKKPINIEVEDVKERMLILEQSIENWGGIQISETVEESYKRLDPSYQETYHATYLINNVIIKQDGINFSSTPNGHLSMKLIYSNQNELDPIENKLRELYDFNN